MIEIPAVASGFRLLAGSSAWAVWIINQALPAVASDYNGRVAGSSGWRFLKRGTSFKKQSKICRAKQGRIFLKIILGFRNLLFFEYPSE